MTVFCFSHPHVKPRQANTLSDGNVILEESMDAWREGMKSVMWYEDREAPSQTKADWMSSVSAAVKSFIF